MVRFLKIPRTSPKQGFTLIELIVVIVIIGIMTALVTVNFIGIRQRGRDAQRKSELRQIQSSFEFYRQDQSEYPELTDLPSCGSVFSEPVSGVRYMQKYPCDPNGTSYYNGGVYFYDRPSADTYNLVACLENENDRDSNVEESFTGGSGTCDSGSFYVLTNP